MKSFIVIIIIISILCCLYILLKKPEFDAKVSAEMSTYQALNDLHHTEVTKKYRYNQLSINPNKKSLREIENKILHMQPNNYIINSLQDYKNYLRQSEND